MQKFSESNLSMIEMWQTQKSSSSFILNYVPFPHKKCFIFSHKFIVEDFQFSCAPNDYLTYLILKLKGVRSSFKIFKKYIYTNFWKNELNCWKIWQQFPVVQSDVKPGIGNILAKFSLVYGWCDFIYILNIIFA